MSARRQLQTGGASLGPSLERGDVLTCGGRLCLWPWSPALKSSSALVSTPVPGLAVLDGGDEVGAEPTLVDVLIASPFCSTGEADFPIFRAIWPLPAGALPR
jgi:hypothetical protein